MLVSSKELEGCTLEATDGEVGRVRDFYFDDERWAVRYVDVETGGWLSGRRVLISPRAVSGIDVEARRIETRLSRRQIEESPDIDTQKPVSRQREAELLRHYGYSPYWGGPYLWGWGANPTVAQPIAPGDDAPVDRIAPETRPPEATGRNAKPDFADSHLRSAHEVSGYRIEATDGGIGHVEEFLVDKESWAIRCIVVDTRNWLPGKHVVVDPERIERVSWAERTVHVNVTRERLKESPEYRPEAQGRTMHPIEGPDRGASRR